MSDKVGVPALAGPERPRFLANENDEKVWDVVLAMSAELASTRARLDALERVLAEASASTRSRASRRARVEASSALIASTTSHTFSSFSLAKNRGLSGPASAGTPTLSLITTPSRRQ